MTATGQRALLGAFVGTVLSALGMWLAPHEPWVAMVPLLLGFLLSSLLAIVGASDGWPELRTVPWPVLVMNAIGWSFLVVLIGGVLAKRKAA